MKTIALFPALVSLFLLLPPPPARGEAPYQFTLSSGAAFLCGQGEEIVYKYEDRDDYLSRLLWDLKPLFCLETGLEFSRARPQEAPGFLAKTAFRFGVPGLSGVMEDRDWASGSGEFLTNYSRHDARTDALFSAELRAGLSAPVFSRFVLKAYLGASYTHVKWTGLDGYTQYAPGGGEVDESTEKKELSGEGIIYSQDWLIVFPGISMETALGKNFRLEIGCDLSPLVCGSARDNHVFRNTLFTDYFVKGGFFWEPRGVLSCRLNDHTALVFRASFRSVKSRRGKSYSEEQPNISGILQGWDPGSGGGYSFLDLGFSVHVSL